MERPVRRLTNVVDTAHGGKFINPTTFRKLCLISPAYSCRGNGSFAGLLARSQYSEGPATGHLDTLFLGFPVSRSEC